MAFRRSSVRFRLAPPPNQLKPFNFFPARRIRRLSGYGNIRIVSELSGAFIETDSIRHRPQPATQVGPSAAATVRLHSHLLKNQI
jgi:hypothetical protein